MHWGHREENYIFLDCSLCALGDLSLSLLTFKAVGVCSEMGNGEVEHSVLTALVRGRPTPAPRNKFAENLFLPSIVQDPFKP